MAEHQRQTDPRTGKSRDQVSQTSKLQQVVQNFFVKASQTVVASRMHTIPVLSKGSGTPKINGWFNLNTEVSDYHKEDLKLWKLDRPYDQIPPMVLETYLDIRGLSSKQTLVLTSDQDGKPWPATKGTKRTEVVLERWLVELSPNSSQAVTEGSIDLLVIYRKCIVLFRALYTFTRLMPAYKLRRKLQKQKLNVSPLKISVRILDGSLPITSRGRVGLSKAIVETPTTSSFSSQQQSQSSSQSQPHLGQYRFAPIQTPVGDFRISVSYRLNCDFKVDDQEQLLSTHFLNLDENSKRPSGGPIDVVRRISVSNNSNTNINAISPSWKTDTNQTSNHVRIPSLSGRNSYKNEDNIHDRDLTSKASINSRRQSVSFMQPFRESSFSGSPASEISIPSSSQSSHPGSYFTRNIYNTTSTSMAQRIPNRSYSNVSIASGGNTTTPVPISTSNDHAISSSISSTSGSARRYSSSFGSRSGWKRPGSVTSVSSKIRRDSNISIASSTYEPASGLYLDESDLAIGEFVKMVDSRRDLKIFDKQQHNASQIFYGSSANSTEDNNHERGSAGTKNALEKFQHLKGTHNALTESISNSLLFSNSPTVSSPHQVYQNSNYSRSSTNSGSPHGASVGAIYNMPNLPGSVISITPSSYKGTSPHFPYTPTIPSRLSEQTSLENEIGSENAYFKERLASDSRTSSTAHQRHISDSVVSKANSYNNVSNPRAIDIPSSLATRFTILNSRGKAALSVSGSHTSEFKHLHAEMELDTVNHPQSMNTNIINTINNEHSIPTNESPDYLQQYISRPSNSDVSRYRTSLRQNSLLGHVSQLDEYDHRQTRSDVTRIGISGRLDSPPHLDTGVGADDDDLVFAMSDMNMI